MLGDLTYQYDPAGNRVGVGGSFARTLLPDPVPSATYDAANRQLTFGAKAMTFDHNGNLASLTDPAGTTTFGWDMRNRLLALSGPGRVGGFQYDTLGRRAAKQLNGQPTQFVYDGADIVEQRDGTGTTTYLRSLNIDEALSFTNRDGIYFSIYDPLGSTLAITNTSASPLVEYSYEPFGRTTSTSPTFANPFQYTSRENDGTGLYYYRARYYYPEAGRFLGEDPIRSAGGSFNFYQYARSNPLRFTDPTGLKLWIYVQASAGGGIGPLAGEGGTYYLVDPSTGESHQWTYLGAGVGLSTGLAGAAQVQAGVYDGPDDPRQISSWSLEFNAFAAAGKGVSGSLTGTSVWGNGEAGWGVGPAAGGGAGVSGIVTYSWYKGKTHVLPESVQGMVNDIARKVQGKK
jgi:RHS repeat-associated protein